MSQIIPPIIQDWLKKLGDPSISDNVKDNYYMNLDHVVQVVTKELRKYELVKISREKKIKR